MFQSHIRESLTEISMSQLVLWLSGAFGLQVHVCMCAYNIWAFLCPEHGWYAEISTRTWIRASVSSRIVSAWSTSK